MPTTTPRLALPYPTPDDTADVPRDIQALANALDSLVYIIGELRTFALAAAPAKWLASGSAVAQTDYPELYAALQNTWNIGGEAAGTFRAGPVVAGRTIVGAGQGPGLTNRAVAARFGVESVGLAAAQNGPHAHTGRTLAGSTDGVGIHAHQSSVDNPTQLCPKATAECSNITWPLALIPCWPLSITPLHVGRTAHTRTQSPP
jgi:microcystin-dependent protein